MSHIVLRHKNPCSECPFSKDSKKGFFGPFKPELYLNIVHHAETGIPCHMFKTEERFKVACVGALQHANASCKIYANPVLYELQKAVGKNPNVLDYMEFKVHHMGYKLKPLRVSDEDQIPEN